MPVRLPVDGQGSPPYDVVRFAWIMFLLLGWTGSLHAQAKISTDMSDVPEDERALLQVPEGFEVQLVAAEPTVINPIQINFDTRGRLWVLCAPRYPQLLPGQEPIDYVVVLDDFDDKGKARKTTVFVDRLTVPTGMIPGDGGVYVGSGEALLHFRDTKGTGKADERRVLLTGFGTADTHHTLNTFRWGPDGALYFNQGLYTHSTVETPFGPRKLFGGAIWRLKTDRLNLEVFDRSILPNNTWGHAFDQWGQSFVASAWPGALNRVLPDSPLQRHTNLEIAPKLKMTQIGGERHCGLDIVSGRHFPDDWQGNLLTGDFMSHKVYRYDLKDDGQNFLAKSLAPLVQGRHRKFRPIDIKQGPDGAIYIADLYQQVIQHNQIDFRDPRRDHSHGRIWRIVRKDRPLTPLPKLVDVPLGDVVTQLSAPEYATRLLAKRVLAESAAETAAKALAARKETTSPRDQLEVLWAYQSIDRVEKDLLTRLLRSDDFHVRAAATRVLGAWQDRLPDAVDLLAQQATDAQPRVRLEAVLAATHVPKAGALPAVLRALDQPVDPMLDFALRKAAVVLQPYWYPEFQAGRLTFDGKTKHLTFALQAIRAPDAVPVLVKLFQNGKIAQPNQVEVLLLIAALGNPVQQALVADVVCGEKVLNEEQRARLMAGLETVVRERKIAPPRDAGRLQAYFTHKDPDLAAAALRLAGAWKVASLRGDITQIIGREVEYTRRQAAIDALVDLGGVDSIKTLETLSTPERPYALRQQAIAGLAALDVNRAVGIATALLRDAPPAGQDPGPIFLAFLRTKGGSDALARGLQKERPAIDSARVGLRVLVGLGSPAPELTAVLHASIGKAGPQRSLDAAEMKRLLALVAKGDPHRGEEVFRRSTLGCFQCHALGGAGGKIGPDLSGIGTSAQPDYLLESIVLPGKIIREGYNTVHVFTSAGKVFSGILQRDTPKELVLRDPLRDDIVIAQDDIEEKKLGGSLMPNGLDLSLTDAELVDLTRFLTELGKPGPFGVTHVRVARRWQMLTAGNASANVDVPALAAAGWAPSYSKVSGQLPLAEVPRSLGKDRGAVRCQIECVTPGKVALGIQQPAGLSLWLGDRQVSLAESNVLDLTRGVHTLTFVIDFAARKEMTLRCELLESPGLTGQARFVDGK